MSGNFQPLEFVDHISKTQPQVVENLNKFTLVPNRRAFGIKAPVGKSSFFLSIEPVHNKSTSWKKNHIMICQGI